MTTPTSQEERISNSQKNLCVIKEYDLQYSMMSLFVKCSTLQQFEIFERYQGDEDTKRNFYKPTQVIINILKQQKYLKIFQCSRFRFHKDFQSAIDFPFQLEKLVLLNCFCMHLSTHKGHQRPRNLHAKWFWDLRWNQTVALQAHWVCYLKCQCWKDFVCQV